MSDEQVQTFEETVNAFYPTDEAEPLEVPTEEVVKDELPEETKEESTDVVDESDEETEEEAASDDEADDTEDVQTVDIDGTEHNLTDITEWKEAHDNVKLMQADCTKKWQEASDLKKSAESQAEKAQDLTLELEALIAEDEEVNMEELKEYDEVEYYQRKEKLDKRKAKVEELKAKKPSAKDLLTQDELTAESNDFYAYDPKWKEGDKLTKAFNDDMKAAGEYLNEMGYSKEDIDNIVYSHQWKTIIDASKYNKQSKKTTEIKKKVRKTPKATKPAAQETNLTAEEIFYPK